MMHIRTAMIATALATLLVAGAGATPLPTTREDFRLPGTQPLSLTDPISTPDSCTPCHANFGQPNVEPYRNWQTSMMAHAGRDPLMWAALAVANQDAPHSGETCLRCHLPKGWLEGRSVPEDGSAMTADDRQGVQCGVCHRLVDPFPDPGNPAADAAILAALTAPVPALGNAMMVVDPIDRLRGPFDIVADLGNDPHAPQRSTLQSPFHVSSDLCGTCHNLRNPAFAKNTLTGEWEPTAFDTPNPDPTSGFPEQSTYDEWAASTYATTGVDAPQFGGENGLATNCQSCHMRPVAGKDASFGKTRTNVPLHDFAGANTFIPSVLAFHPAFGAEVNPDHLAQGVVNATGMLRKAATVSASLTAGDLVVRVTNETGHKLPTGYPEGRRMWLHVRAFDAQRNVIFESGRYVFSSATLTGYGAQMGDPGYDPYLKVWETEQGISPALAPVVGMPAGRSFHLVLNNQILRDNRIPPRGFTNAAFEAIDAAPVGATYADGQYWDDTHYPVGAAATSAQVTLYYQTSSREYVEFLRDTNTTTAAGNILFNLWDEHNQSVPVQMSDTFVETNAVVVNACRKSISRLQSKYAKRYYKEWSRCFSSETRGLTCDAVSRDANIDKEASRLRLRLGGSGDTICAARNLTPGSLGHGSTCPAPCAGTTLFDMNDLASCTICLAEALEDAALGSAYGSDPPALPNNVPPGSVDCQRSLDVAADRLARGWNQALGRCEAANASGRNQPPLDCASDPDGLIGRAKSKAAAQIQRCDTFAGIAGCATGGTAAAVQACMETAVGAVVGPYTEVAYP
ncbi:MAG TPA: multiheme c-type cytochrome [Candidatus Eisenbacteria bacterium]|nr:multiheme c-type cytochrome [Candidatus Eisenbacteria bacterium]